MTWNCSITELRRVFLLRSCCFSRIMKGIYRWPRTWALWREPLFNHQLWSYPPTHEETIIIIEKNTAKIQDRELTSGGFEMIPLLHKKKQNMLPSTCWVKLHYPLRIVTYCYCFFDICVGGEVFFTFFPSFLNHLPHQKTLASHRNAVLPPRLVGFLRASRAHRWRLGSCRVESRRGGFFGEPSARPKGGRWRVKPVGGLSQLWVPYK